MTVAVSVVLLVAALGALGAAQPEGPAADLLALLAPRLQPPSPDAWLPLVPPQDMYFDAPSTQDQLPEERYKRAGNGPSLSIINPLDVLRQRLLLEMARRQMRESQKQVAENRKLMKTIGKRGSFLRQPFSLQ